MNPLIKMQDSFTFIFTFTILLIICHLDSAGQFNEDFSDNDLSNNPQWTGNIDKFVIEDGKLRSNSTTTFDEFYISTPSQSVLETEWQISLDLDFKTSSANYIDIFLASDSSNPSKASQAYFIRIGDTKDDISMYQIINGIKTQLTNGTNDKTEKNKMNIHVIHQPNGQWQIKVDYNDGNSPVLEGTVNNIELSKTDFFALRIKQSSSSFFKKHRIDHIRVGPILIDQTPPRVDSMIIQNPKTLILSTNEPTSTNQALFELNKSIGTPSLINVTNTHIILHYEDSIKNGNYILSIKKLTDLHGNRIDTLIPFSVNLPKIPKNGDIIINEIMPDPSPPVDLPNAEFIELLNLKNYPLNLENCTFADENSLITLPKIIVPKNEYVILCNETDLELFQSFPNVYGIKSLPSLNNSEDKIIIKNQYNELMDSLSYTNNFFKNEVKRKGGYSLERIQPTTNCQDSLNWIGSNHITGVTPGEVNSVDGEIYDSIPPYVLSASSDNHNTIHLQLNELPTNFEAFEITNYELVQGKYNPVKINLNESTMTISVEFENQLPLNSIFKLMIKYLVDCSGNKSHDTLINIIPIQKAKKGDIIINEILFNPYPNGVDFIELYNASDHLFNLHEFTFKTYHPYSTTYAIQSHKDSIIYPNQFIALSIDTGQIKFDYPKSKTQLQLSKMPPMNNTEGILSLYQSDFLLDSISYHEDQHFNLLNDYNGVSLERINYDNNGHDPNNWHSTSSTEGFATPGYQNSQYIHTLRTTNQFELNSSILSPDGDGYEDFLVLKYQMNNLGYILNGYIYNLAGFQVHHPFNNILLGSNGNLKWDGLDSNGIKLPIGNYILLVEAFNETGKIIKRKIAFGITGIF